jgi:hypothetical protein
MEDSGAPGSTDNVDLPSGDEPGVVVRTFLIADVRGYTHFTQEHGDQEAGQLAARFAALVREAVTATRGEVVELRGDEALCVFPSGAAGASRCRRAPGPLSSASRGPARLPTRNRHRPGCRRGGARRGWLPRRRAEPGRPPLQPRRSRPDPRQRDRREPVTNARGSSLRRTSESADERAGEARAFDRGHPRGRAPATAGGAWAEWAPTRSALDLSLKFPGPHAERETLASIFKSGTLDGHGGDAVVEADVDADGHSWLWLQSCRVGQKRPQFGLVDERTQGRSFRWIIVVAIPT